MRPRSWELARPAGKHQAAERGTSSQSASLAEEEGRAGWACLRWPKEYGGRGATPIERVIWQHEEGDYGKLSAFRIGHGMCGPTMIAFGSEEHKRRLAEARLRRGSLVPAVSEPVGGSDLAGLRTRAREGGRRLGHRRTENVDVRRPLLPLRSSITRTDPNVPKHKGLTMFYIDMKRPGVEVQPIKQASGWRNSTRCISPTS